MNEPIRFRHQLATRILGLVGAASLAACSGGSAGSTGTSTATTTGATATSDAGTGGAGGAGGGSAGGGGMGGSTGIAPVQACFSLPIDAGADVIFDAGADPGTCPNDLKAALADFLALNCPDGWEPYKVVSGPTMDAQGACCYMVLNTLCGPGGRPFLAGGEARVAAIRVDEGRGAGARGWAAGNGPLLEGLSAAQRESLARAWTTDALFEHASVASFARFSLALMAAGAPADLVELAHRAALDEVRHAQLCFALASAYAGEELGPGPFPVDGSGPVAATLAEIAASTAAEGCVGETVAAVVAAEQLARATDPAVRAVLAQIAEDEARHAELAWKTVAWAVQTGGSEVRAAVAQALFQALAGSRRAEMGDASALVPVASGSEVLEAHGRLDQATAARVTAAAVADVIAPAARALFQVEVLS